MPSKCDIPHIEVIFLCLYVDSDMSIQNLSSRTTDHAFTYR